MPVPFRRTSKTRKAKRRTHQRAKKPTTIMCENCGKNIKSHTVCKHCGFYKGKQVIKSKDE
ncbi:MAG: 50S ribosomal protein L32 [Mycoplasmataceae bacterium]|nr:50S ribosomal protein L32 [Mycoplasmataceae bacterium]